ncbi:hypothetical protein VB715_21485 [Crocosphaera sp. UHCC 0190]|uniref:hypothetical protein n=1 Tax=Crocosphaera sp. UHCC 0190 TaxID=3110246 RepID=UPI002B1F93F7|nr:hypothetical protein [Crocosphaera sp. UHCC 0190]MEA5512350.1 hypothetical protein [Crocosphaera sp. UHCC 0190]
MSKFNLTKSGISALSVLLLGLTATPLLPVVSVLAQPYPTPNQNTVENYNTVIIPSGTLIPVSYEGESPIRVNQGEYIPLELQVAANLSDRNGNLLIPAGTIIRGQLEPADPGAQYVAREMIINGNQWIPLNATSHIVARVETVNDGATIANILSGTFAGAGTATIIAGTTGDRRIEPLEVLGGAALGTFLGWGLPEGQIIGGGTHQVVVINPDRDLTLTLNSDVAVTPSANTSRSIRW